MAPDATSVRHPHPHPHPHIMRRTATRNHTQLHRLQLAIGLPPRAAQAPRSRGRPQRSSLEPAALAAAADDTIGPAAARRIPILDRAHIRDVWAHVRFDSRWGISALTLATVSSVNVARVRPLLRFASSEAPWTRARIRAAPRPRAPNATRAEPRRRDIAVLALGVFCQRRAIVRTKHGDPFPLDRVEHPHGSRSRSSRPSTTARTRYPIRVS